MAGVKEIKEGQVWRTERLAASKTTEMHVCATATVDGVERTPGGPLVRYHYSDYTSIGSFCGRDAMPEHDFRKAFPVLELEDSGDWLDKAPGGLTGKLREIGRTGFAG